ncbi:MAG: hypothetical protein WDA20_13965 [Desulfuromonadales bacterium]
MPRSLWPKTKFAETNTIAEQLAHIFSEIDEAAEAADLCVHVSPGEDVVSGKLSLFRELADLQHSIETLWHILDRKTFPGFSDQQIFFWVEEKNRVRGYYVEDERTGVERLAEGYEGAEYRSVRESMTELFVLPTEKICQESGSVDKDIARTGETIKEVLPPGRIEVHRDLVDEKFDELAEICEHWKKNRENGRQPNAIRAAILMLVEEVLEKNRARGYYVENVSEWCEGCRSYHPPTTPHAPKPVYGKSPLAQMIENLEGVSYAAVLPGGPRGNEEEHF